MSYDLAVFEPRDELRERSVFLAWFEARTEWSVGTDYSNPANASPALQAWYREMISTFPPLNGPDRPRDLEQACADYSIGAELIYVGFSRAKSRIAYDIVFSLAGKHGVGFFDASGDSSVWFPSIGKLKLAHERRDSDPPSRMLKMMRAAIARHGAVQVETLEDALARMDALAGKPEGMNPIVIGRKAEKDDGNG